MIVSLLTAVFSFYKEDKKLFLRNVFITPSDEWRRVQGMSGGRLNDCVIVYVCSKRMNDSTKPESNITERFHQCLLDQSYFNQWSNRRRKQCHLIIKRNPGFIVLNILNKATSGIVLCEEPVKQLIISYSGSQIIKRYLYIRFCSVPEETTDEIFLMCFIWTFCRRKTSAQCSRELINSRYQNVDSIR